MSCLNVKLKFKVLFNILGSMFTSLCAAMFVIWCQVAIFVDLTGLKWAGQRSNGCVAILVTLLGEHTRV